MHTICWPACLAYHICFRVREHTWALPLLIVEADRWTLLSDCHAEQRVNLYHKPSTSLLVFTCQSLRYPVYLI
jgi:hypothetical protein